jgi:hypothetical protein
MPVAPGEEPSAFDGARADVASCDLLPEVTLEPAGTTGPIATDVEPAAEEEGGSAPERCDDPTRGVSPDYEDDASSVVAADDRVEPSFEGARTLAREAPWVPDDETPAPRAAEASAPTFATPVIELPTATIDADELAGGDVEPIEQDECSVEHAPSPRPQPSARYAPRKSDLTELLAGFTVAGSRTDRELARDLKRMAGIEPTAPPPAVSCEPSADDGPQNGGR